MYRSHTCDLVKQTAASHNIEQKKTHAPDNIIRILDEGGPQKSEQGSINRATIEQEEVEDDDADMLKYEDNESSEDDDIVDDSQESSDFIYHQKRNSTRPLNSDPLAVSLCCTPEAPHGD